MKADLALYGVVAVAVLAQASAALAGNPQQSSVGTSEKPAVEYIDDAAVTARIKLTFVQDQAVRASNISVETSKGRVQLSGFAGSQTEIDRAVALAGRVPGVRVVRNKIRLK